MRGARGAFVSLKGGGGQAGFPNCMPQGALQAHRRRRRKSVPRASVPLLQCVERPWSPWPVPSPALCSFVCVSHLIFDEISANATPLYMGSFSAASDLRIEAISVDATSFDVVVAGPTSSLLPPTSPASFALTCRNCAPRPLVPPSSPLLSS